MREAVEKEAMVNGYGEYVENLSHNEDTNIGACDKNLLFQYHT